VAIAAGICSLLSSHVLLVFVSGLIVYSFALVSFAVLMGRARGQTGCRGLWRSWLYPLAPILGLVLALAFAAADWADPDAGRPSLVILGALLLAAFAWYRLVLSRRPGGWVPRIEHHPTSADGGSAAG
jgi:hypothetical protein